MAGRGINKVILVGNLGNDPEIRYTPGGAAVANVSIATTEFWKDRNTGERQERTEWHRVVFFSRLAEIVEQYLKKGAKVYVEGSLRTNSWEKDGIKRYTTEIIANEMRMLDTRGGGEGGGFEPRQPAQSAPGGDKPQAKAAEAQGGGSSFDNFDDDDIPF